MTYLHNLALTAAWVATSLGGLSVFPGAVLIALAHDDNYPRSFDKRWWYLPIVGIIAIIIAAPYLATELHH